MIQHETSRREETGEGRQCIANDRKQKDERLKHQVYFSISTASQNQKLSASFTSEMWKVGPKELRHIGKEHKSGQFSKLELRHRSSSSSLGQDFCFVLVFVPFSLISSIVYGKLKKKIHEKFIPLTSSFITTFHFSKGISIAHLGH